ncbi:hypothetical protein [Streptomyces sp. VNUA74]|uniref:hypothetical protein n=1 Tax=Streptomyces sp. VNUA74 TaxID=3062685 RepID=UPI0035B2623A
MPMFDQRQGPSERSGRSASRQDKAAATRPPTPLQGLLAAQNTAGNTAVVQMLRKAGHGFAQHTHGAGCGHDAGTGGGAGARTSAPGAKGSAGAPPVQRVAKESVYQPDASEQSAQVPDLPQELVAAIGQAQTAAQRRAVLQQLLTYIMGRFDQLNVSGLLTGDQAGLLENLYQRVQVGYSHTRPGAMAHTQEQLGRATGAQIDSPPIVITVYRSAFDGGAAQLYSTLRHELIHAVQRSMVPDEGQAAATDDVMFEDLYEPATGVPTRNSLQLPLQEIETHVWELTHAGETGIDGGYAADTVTYLLQYAQQLTQGVARVTADQFAYWVNYLARAVGMLTDAASVIGDPNVSAQLQQAAAALQAAINNRSGSGGSGKRGSKRSGGGGSGGSGSGGKRSGGSSSGKRHRSRRTAA